MWDLPRLVQIKKARRALRHGRLDEAFAVATRPELRDDRQAQEVLEKLVDPLLERARAHLEAGRFEDALADVDRAREAGGNDPRAAELRESALEAMRAEVEEHRKARQVFESVEGHLREGRLEDGEERLAAVPSDEVGASVLKRRLGRLRREAAEARERCRHLLEGGEIEGAVDSLLVLRAVAARQSDTRELSDEVARRGAAAARESIEKGDFEKARRLLEKLSRLESDHEDLHRAAKALRLADKASLALDRLDTAGGRVSLGRLCRLLPEAEWAVRAESRMGEIEEALRELRAGPLGEQLSALGHGAAADAPEAARTLVVTSKEPGDEGKAPREDPGGGGDAHCPLKARGGRYLLWIDGIGSYLVLTSDNVSIGRAGSSAGADIALPADVDGIHAQILRVDQDYFLVARGRTEVAGRQIDRHLLADGDEVRLGSRATFTFRMPTPLSPTAILRLGTPATVCGDVREVILLDQHLILGPAGNGHLEIPRGGERILLSHGPEGFRCRAPVPIVIDGKPLSAEERIPPGAHVEAGPLTFTFTKVTPEEAGR